MLNLLARPSEPNYESYVPSSRNTSASAATASPSQNIIKKIRRARQERKAQNLLEAARGSVPQTPDAQLQGDTQLSADESAQSASQPIVELEEAICATPSEWIPVVRPASSRSKRAFDIVGASCCLVALAPVMLSLAFLVKRDGGPAIFGHRRIGTDGKPFLCLKFRSMCTDAEQKLQDHLQSNPDAKAEWERDFKLRNDPRVTSLGELLRRTSLDELPQLLNVIRGEMSLVGPRPIVADEIPRYGDYFDAYRDCRPGITGLWQISGRNDVNYKTRIRLDRFYATRWTFMKDVAILLRTVGVVLRRSGAY